MTFSFEDGLDSIDEVLQEVKESIFRTPRDPLDMIRLEWATQLSCTLECYNVIAKEEVRIRGRLTFQNQKAIARFKDHRLRTLI